jgi:hypothetical protein
MLRTNIGQAEASSNVGRWEPMRLILSISNNFECTFWFNLW